MLKFFRFNNSLVKRFSLMFSIIIIVPIMTMGMIGYFKSTSEIQSQNEKYLLRINQIISRQLDSYIDSYEQLSLQIISAKAVKEFITSDPEDTYKNYEFNEWIRRNLIETIIIQDPLIQDFYIVSDTGNTYSIQQNIMTVDTDRLKLLLPEDGRIALLTSPFNEIFQDITIPDTHMITFGRRIFSSPTKESDGSFALSLQPSRLDILWKDNALEDSETFIVDQEGYILFHPDTQRIDKHITSMMKLPDDFSSHGSYITKISGIRHFIAYSTSEYTEWQVFSIIPMEIVSKPTREVRNLLLLTAFNAFILTMLVGNLLTNSIIRPVEKLQKVMKKNSPGKIVTVEEPFPPNEVGDLMRIYNQMVHRIEHLIEQVYKKEKEKKTEEIAKEKAQFQALQMQINPHFLYNTLGAINAYSLTNQRKPMEEMIDSLSNMFRYAVQSTIESVKLKDEIAHLKNYLLIQQHRTGMLPLIDWDIDSSHHDKGILRLTLQPLVENIFHHAFPEGIERHHWIRISSAITEEAFTVTVSDNGAGFDTGTLDLTSTENLMRSDGKHIGLANINRRMHIAYGGDYGLLINSSTSGTDVILILPI